MSEPTSNSTAQPIPEQHPLQAVLRFLRAVYYRKAVLIVALAASCLLGSLYYVTATPVYESRASLLVLNTGDTDSLSTKMSAGQSSQNLMVTYKNMLQSEVVMEAALEILPPEYRTDLEGIPEEEWPHALQKKLHVAFERKATILLLAYQSTDPETAAAVVDSIQTAYLDFMEDLHQNTAGELLDILNNEKTKLEEQMQLKRVELLAARRNTPELGIREGDRGTSALVKRVMSLNEAWITTQEKRLDAQSRLVAVEAAIHNGEDLAQFAMTMAGQVGGDTFLQQLGIPVSDPNADAILRRQLIADRARLQADLQLYGPAHRKVREAQERIRATEAFFESQYQISAGRSGLPGNEQLADKLLTRMHREYKHAASREGLAQQCYEEAKLAASKLDGAKAELEMLALDCDRLQRTYDVVLEQLKDIKLSQQSGMLRTAVLERPEVSRNPIWPRMFVVLSLSILIGTGAGLAVVYLQDLLDDHFRSPEELEALMRLPVLAMVRRLEPLAETGIDAIHAHVRPNASETEAFRTLRTALALSEENVQRIVISSSEPGDGKTTMTVNLAVAYAQSGKRTLLIDADLRRPGLTPQLDFKSRQGLSTLLRGEGPLDDAVEECLCTSVVENLDVLPSGPRSANPTEMLAGQRFAELLAWAETRYDQILIDSPPAFVSDTAIIGRLVDGVLLTVQPEKNCRKVVLRAADSFLNLGIRVLGVVLNRVSPENGKDYYGYGYGYCYGYGHDDEQTDNVEPPELLVQPTRRTLRKAA